MLTPNDVGLYRHKVLQINADIPEGVTVKQLEDPKYWSNVSNKLMPRPNEVGSEVRALWVDMSQVAYGIVTFANGSDVRIKFHTVHELDKVDVDADDCDYGLKQRGPKKWCIVKKSDGTIIQEGIATKPEALKALEEYRQVLSN